MDVRWTLKQRCCAYWVVLKSQTHQSFSVLLSITSSVLCSSAAAPEVAVNSSMVLFCSLLMLLNTEEIALPTCCSWKSEILRCGDSTSLGEVKENKDVFLDRSPITDTSSPLLSLSLFIMCTRPATKTKCLVAAEKLCLLRV